MSNSYIKFKNERINIVFLIKFTYGLSVVMNRIRNYCTFNEN